MSKNLLYLLTILEAIEKILIYKDDYSKSKDFYEADDQKSFNATLNLLTAIGEEIKKIDDSLKQKNKIINWRALAGLRDIIAHNYRGIDKYLIWDIINNELIELKSVCIGLLKIIKPNKKELLEYLSTEFYKHIAYLKDKI